MIDNGIEVKENVPKSSLDENFYRDSVDALYSTKEIAIYGKGKISLSLEDIKGAENPHINIDASARNNDLIIVKTVVSDDSFSGYISSISKRIGDFYITNMENGETYRFMVKF